MISEFPKRTTPLAPEAGLGVSDDIGTLVGGLGCLSGNVTQAVQEIQRALAEGTIGDREAREIVHRLRDAHEHVERACRDVSRLRSDLADGD